MKIVVNGEAREVEAGMSVRRLIEQMAPRGAACAAEVNRELVARRDQEKKVLQEGDSVEIVTLVGGG